MEQVILQTEKNGLRCTNFNLDNYKGGIDMEISVDAKVFIEEQFSEDTNNVEDVCRLYSEYRIFLEKQMKNMVEIYMKEDE